MKNQLYENLEMAVNRIPKIDILIVVGDWNPRTSVQETPTHHFLGKFDLGQCCENAVILTRCTQTTHGSSTPEDNV